MKHRVRLKTRQHEHGEAHRYKAENEIDLNKRSVLSRCLPWLMVIMCMIIAVSATNQIMAVPVDPVVPQSNPSIPMFRPATKIEIPDRKVEQILAWIKTKKPEWDTQRENLTFYLASQTYIDKFLKNEYDERKAKGWYVPEHFKEPGRSAAFFTKTDSGSYIYLPWDFALYNVKDTATLVHELVHYSQRRNGVEARCEGEKEFAAHFYAATYLIEVLYLASDSKTVVWNMEQASEHVCDSGG